MTAEHKKEKKIPGLVGVDGQRLQCRAKLVSAPAGPSPLASLKEFSARSSLNVEMGDFLLGTIVCMIISKDLL